MNSQCGLVDAENPCRCAKKTRAFNRGGSGGPRAPALRAPIPAIDQRRRVGRGGEARELAFGISRTAFPRRPGRCGVSRPAAGRDGRDRVNGTVFGELAPERWRRASPEPRGAAFAVSRASVLRSGRKTGEYER